jgi:hypothetical protein
MATGLILGLLWTALPELAGWLFRHYRAAPRWLPYVVTLVILAVASGIVWWGKESMTKTAVNRRTQSVAMLMFALQLTLQLGGNLLGVPMLQLFVLYLYCWFFSTAVFVVFIDRRFWPSAGAFLAAFVGACLEPEWVWHLMAASNFALTINLLVAWSRPSEDRDFFMERVRQRMDRVRR